MKDKQVKYPQLRFKGFTDPWEERKLSEIVDIYDGTHQTPIYTDSGVKFVSVENISNLETKKYISQEAYNKEYAKKQAQKGDVLMTRIGDIGTSRVIETEEPLAYYVTLSLLKPKKIESNFLSWLISSPEVQRNIWKRTLHIAFPKKINLGEINQVEVMIPKNKEQQKIGSFFKQLDDTIALHQRKLDLLKEQKKGYLQKMFPKNGAKVPELRFAGFADDWEQRKTKELCDISTGKGNTQDKVEDGKYPFYVRSATIERSNEYLYDQEAVLTVGDGVGTGKVFHYVNGKYNLHQRVYRMFNFNHGVSAKYFYHYFSKNFYRRVMSMTAKTSVDSVRMEMIADMKIKFPSPAEQETIVSVLDGVDNTIALHQRKLDLLKEQKKGFLQNMFV